MQFGILLTPYGLSVLRLLLDSLRQFLLVPWNNGNVVLSYGFGQSRGHPPFGTMSSFNYNG